MSEVFWLKGFRLGRLHILIGRNDDIRNRVPPLTPFKKRSFNFDRAGKQIFISGRIGVRFINIDWV